MTICFSCEQNYIIMFFVYPVVLSYCLIYFVVVAFCKVILVLCDKLLLNIGGDVILCKY